MPQPPSAVCLSHLETFGSSPLPPPDSGEDSNALRSRPSDVTSAIPVRGQSEGRIPGEARGGGGGLCACARSPRGYINMAGGAARWGCAECA